MTLSWADPEDQQVDQFGSMEHWQNLAQTMERGKFDGLFFADVPSVYDMYKNTTDYAVKHGVSWPAHDPVTLVGIMGAATKRLGIAPTVSAASLHPFLAVRSLSSLEQFWRRSRTCRRRRAARSSTPTRGSSVRRQAPARAQRRWST